MNTQQKCPHCITPAFTCHSIYYTIAWLLSQFIQHCFTCLLLINQMFTIARLLTGKVQICKLAVSGVRLQILISNSNAQSSTPLIYTHNSKNILQKCWYQSTLWLLLWCMLWNKTLLSRLFCPNSFTSYSSNQWSLKSLISSTSSCTGTLKFTKQTIRCLCVQIVFIELCFWQDTEEINGGKAWRRSSLRTIAYLSILLDRHIYCKQLKDLNTDGNVSSKHVIREKLNRKK